MSRNLMIGLVVTSAGLLTLSLLSLLLLLYGNDWWLSGLITLTVMAWLGGFLAVVYQQGRVRAAATGAVIFGAAYWLLALGPWFSVNVGPTLLTSRGLSQIDVLLHGAPQQTQTLAWTSYPATQPVYVTGSSVVTNTVQTTFAPQANIAIVNTTAAPPGSTVFQSLGHWLLVWLCALAGGFAALLMGLRRERKQPAVPGDAT